MVEVEFSVTDYKTILNWFELAFASSKTKTNVEDEKTFKKVTVMCMVKLEESKDNED
jgi:hypothetical protein